MSSLVRSAAGKIEAVRRKGGRNTDAGAILPSTIPRIAEQVSTVPG